MTGVALTAGLLVEPRPVDPLFDVVSAVVYALLACAVAGALYLAWRANPPWRG